MMKTKIRTRRQKMQIRDKVSSVYHFIRFVYVTFSTYCAYTAINLNLKYFLNGTQIKFYIAFVMVNC